LSRLARSPWAVPRRLRHQDELFGAVASASTCWRVLDGIGRAQRRRVSRARAKTRARVWALMGQVPAAWAAGRDIGEGVVVLDVDSTIVLAHSDKDGAAPTYKHTWGFHPILVTCDNTNEMLAIRLRPGNAGANTTADHLDVLGEAFAQIPATHGRHLLVRGDSAAATHAILDWLHEQGQRRARTVEYSIGWAIGESERAAITTLSPSAWSAALDAEGQVRDGAQVAELTGLLDLGGWPAGMRVIVRRERPHPRRSTVAVRGGRRLALHRVRHQHPAGTAAMAGGPPPRPRPGRGPDPLRERHRSGPATLPGIRDQPSLVPRRRDRRRPDRLATDPRPGRRVGARGTQTAALPAATHRSPPRPRTTPPLATHPIDMALGKVAYRRVHPDRGHPRTRLTRSAPDPTTGGPQETRPPPRQTAHHPATNPGHIENQR